MPKVLALLFFSCFAIVMLGDILVIYGSYYKIEKSLGQAIDGALVEVANEDDYKRGLVTINEGMARLAARKLLIDNLQLDSQLESELFVNSSLEVKIGYYQDMPRLEAQYSTEVSFRVGKLVGLDSFPIKVKKKTPYLAEYK